MVVIFLVGFFLFNFVSAWADNGSSVQNVDGCNTINTTGATYLLSEDVNSTETCFTISAQNTVLDCQNNWINYSIGGTASTYGVLTTQLNTTIKNCNILDSNRTSSVNSRYGVYFNGADNGTLENNVVNSSNSFGIYLRNLANYNTLINNTISSSTNALYLRLSSNYNTLINNTIISSSANAIYVPDSSWNNFTGNVGTTGSSTTFHGGIRIDSSNNTLTNNTGISTSASSGILLYESLSIRNNLTNNVGTSDSGYGIAIYLGSYNNLTNNVGTSDSGYGFYTQNSTNSFFINNSISSNSTWPIYNVPAYSSALLNVSSTLASTYTTLDSFCYPPIYSNSANFSYKRSEETSWRTQGINRATDIYTLGDSISFAGKWQSSLDSYMGSNSEFNNLGVGGTICAYSYERYLQNVSTDSNATVIVFCGINDAILNVPFANTTFYLESMYNLSVDRNQDIVFVNTGGLTSGNCSASISINNWLSDFTQSKGVPMVDFNSFFTTDSSTCTANETLTPDGDGVHPNDAAYTLLGELIWEQGFNSSVTYTLNSPLIHVDKGKTYDIKCFSDYDNNTFQTTYSFPSDFVSGGGLLNNASTLNATLSNLNATINGSGFNSSSVYYGSVLVNITSDSLPVLNLNYNFSKYDFNFTNVTIYNKTDGDKAFLSVWGIPSDGVVNGKNLTLYDVTTSYNSVCVKDEENVVNISSACTDTNEYKVLCDGASHDGYTCTLSGTTLTVTGLQNSGIVQLSQDVSSDAEDSSTTSSGSVGTFKPYESNLESGYNIRMIKDQKIEIPVGDLGEKKTIVVESISGGKVVLSVDGTQYGIYENSSGKIDLNGDGFYDVEIMNKGNIGNSANLEFKSIHEEIPKEEQEEQKEGNIINEIPEIVKKLNWKIYVGIGIVVVLIVSLSFLKKKKSKR